MKPVTTIPGETGSTPIIGTQVERAFSLMRVKYSLNQPKGWNNLGYHIGLLIMAALSYLAPQFIKEGRLCWLHAPLYIISDGKKETYAFTDEEMNSMRGKAKGNITRNKGLGEMTAESARRSMFTSEFQRMEILEYSDEAMEILYALMGEDVEPRREFVMTRIDFSEIKE